MGVSPVGGSHIRMVLKPFSLTYILYDEEDGLFGWLMALLSLAPV